MHYHDSMFCHVSPPGFSTRQFQPLSETYFCGNRSTVVHLQIVIVVDVYLIIIDVC